MPKPTARCCFCCVPLESGVKWLGYIMTVLALLGIIINVFYLVNVSDSEENKEIDRMVDNMFDTKNTSNTNENEEFERITENSFDASNNYTNTKTYRLSSPVDLLTTVIVELVLYILLLVFSVMLVIGIKRVSKIWNIIYFQLCFFVFLIYFCILQRNHNFVLPWLITFGVYIVFNSICSFYPDWIVLIEFIVICKMIICYDF